MKIIYHIYKNKVQWGKVVMECKVTEYERSHKPYNKQSKPTAFCDSFWTNGGEIYQAITKLFIQT